MRYLGRQTCKTASVDLTDALNGSAQLTEETPSSCPPLRTGLALFDNGLFPDETLRHDGFINIRRSTSSS